MLKIEIHPSAKKALDEMQAEDREAMMRLIQNASIDLQRFRKGEIIYGVSRITDGRYSIHFSSNDYSIRIFHAFVS